MNERINTLKRMNDCIINYGDEDIYEQWIAYGCPDESTYEDFAMIAQDDNEYKEVIELFYQLQEEGDLI